MAEIYLVRHGQASLGSHNYDQLSANGIQQAQWLGQYFRQQQLSFDHVISGTLSRHRQTVQGIAQGLQQPIECVEELIGINEFDFQQISHRFVEHHPEQALNKEASPRDFFRLLKKALYAWSENDFDHGDLESWQQFNQRVSDALTHVKRQHHGKKVLMVSSGGVIASMVAQTLNAGAASVIELNLQTKNTGLSQFIFNRKHLRLSSFNNTPHLDAPERKQQRTFA
ncbi:phosphoglycerate mutase GpmB [Sinobacterium norvegicum]|uniref:Phosphoglycerate mutase GpmB n=1 Tax=Sinobacterium norvegicum TaxID=1641715 RepID=A0ABM9ACJ2_9GAMM|nr:histidine phosphatase family protein [Sinobacterium norvegicum]CAH0990654.1 phosphoglycerate mutase GpmB [Sinobacterium norvegicum]